MKCPVCKNEIARVDGRCPHCGCNLDDPQMIERIIQEQEKEEKKATPRHSSGGKRSKKKLFVGLWAGVAVVVVATCIFAVLSTQPKGDQKVVASQTQTPKPSAPKPTATSKFSFKPIISSASAVATPSDYRADLNLDFPWIKQNIKRYDSRLDVTFDVENRWDKGIEAFYMSVRVLNGNWIQIYKSTPEWIRCDIPENVTKTVTCTLPYREIDGAYYLYVDIYKVRFTDGIDMDSKKFNNVRWTLG